MKKFVYRIFILVIFLNFTPLFSNSLREIIDDGISEKIVKVSSDDKDVRYTYENASGYEWTIDVGSKKITVCPYDLKKNDVRFKLLKWNDTGWWLSLGYVEAPFYYKITESIADRLEKYRNEIELETKFPSLSSPESNKKGLLIVVFVTTLLIIFGNIITRRLNKKN